MYRFSLVVKYETQVKIWSLFFVVIDQDMDIIQFDIHITFLHGNSFEGGDRHLATPRI